MAADVGVPVLFAYLVPYLAITLIAFLSASPERIRSGADREVRGTFLQRYVLGTASFWRCHSSSSKAGRAKRAPELAAALTFCQVDAQGAVPDGTSHSRTPSFASGASGAPYWSGLSESSSGSSTPPRVLPARNRPSGLKASSRISSSP